MDPVQPRAAPANATPLAVGTAVTRPVATIVIPAWNAWEFTERCLQSLRPTLGPQDQVVVVDNGSTDGTRESLAAYGWVDVIANSENQGFGRACNQGAAEAVGAVLVFLNSDTIVPVGWLDELLGPFDQSDVGAVGPRSDNVSGRQKTPAVPRPHGGCRRLRRLYRGMAGQSPGSDVRGSAVDRILSRRPHVVLPCAGRIRRAVRGRGLRGRRPVPTSARGRLPAAHRARFLRPPSRPCFVRRQ